MEINARGNKKNRRGERKRRSGVRQGIRGREGKGRDGGGEKKLTKKGR